MEVLKIDPCGVLLGFLQWPFQSFFNGVANCTWDLSLKKQYSFVLSTIIWKVKGGYKDWDYQNLFREFWQDSPNAVKSFLIDKVDESRVLPFLFHIKDKDSIRLILKNTTLTVKEKLIYSDEMSTFCESFIRDNEWDFLAFCVRECCPSKNAMLEFKEKFEKACF